MRILLLEGEDAVRAAVTEQIQRSYADAEVVCVPTLASGLEAVQDDFDIVVADLSLPDASGLEIVYRLVDDDDAPPLIVLTKPEDEAAFTGAMRVGAQDVLSRSELSTLPRALRYAIEHRRLEDECEHQRRTLARSEAGYRAIASNADGVVMIGEDGRIAWANRAAAEIFGHTDELEILDWMFPASLADGDRRRISVRRRDGQSLAVDVRAVATRWEGRPAIVASLRDVTSADRTEKALLKAQKLSVVTRMAGGVAHDFNNLLTGLLGNVDLIDEELETSHPARKWLRRLARELAFAERMVGRMVAFSGHQTSDRRPLDVNVVIEGLSTMLGHLVGEQVGLEVHVQPHLDEVLADRVELEQILLNLVSNARDAVADGGSIRIRTTTPTRGRIAIVVEDDGVGMDAATAARAREAFYTTKSPTTGSGHPTALGLGLTTAADIVEHLGGVLKLFSTPEAGTTVWVELPAAPGSTSLAGTNSVPRLEARSATILVVDDEPVIRDLLQRMLTREGHRVLVATSGPAAIGRVLGHAGPLDLLLTDVMMPEMNGLELAGQLHKIRPDLPVLFMSGYDERILGPSGVLEDGITLLRKPFRMADALEAVGDMLAKTIPVGSDSLGEDWDSDIGLGPIVLPLDDPWSSRRDSDFKPR